MTDHAIQRLTERLGLTYHEATATLDSLHRPATIAADRALSAVVPGGEYPHRLRLASRVHGERVNLIWDVDDETFVTVFQSDEPAPFIHPVL